MDGYCAMPEHVLFDILLWLPVVSLLRFKSVCKSWFILIGSSNFITQHLHHNRDRDNLIASYTHDRSYDFCLLSGNRYEVYTSLNFEDQWYSTIGDGCVELTGSCNGIVCLYDWDSWDIALWNPAMKQLKSLPKSSITPRIYKAGEMVEGMQCIVVGIGFDAKTNDYKVVRIILLSVMPFNQVEVYNLRTASWRIIHKNDILPFNIIFNPIHATSKSGTCFWGGYNDLDDLLVSFDLKDEVFGTMPFPDKRVYDCWYALDFLNDKLAYIKGVDKDKCPHDRHFYFEIWVLHEFGVKESWSKIYKIGPTPDIGEGLFPFGFSKNAEFLLLGTGTSSTYVDQLHLYNLVTQEEHYPPIQESYPGLHQFLHYNGSLVSIKKVEEEGCTTAC